MAAGPKPTSPPIACKASLEIDAERIDGKAHQAWHISDTPISFHPFGIQLLTSLSVISTHMSSIGPATTNLFSIGGIDVEALENANTDMNDTQRVTQSRIHSDTQLPHTVVDPTVNRHS